ncbi:hypothetical protein CU669_04115 [Paramagnetospirillum kuznetsovii]|uniref:Uncharacterized protein n=1 Tax=Paramagnetospirillum kuznetsovii TaxID=2053833 RepID=A0A364P2E2_9PROT|nr:hypothetical protein [Paramagnetospirillum kuznetsovii]RAU23327.1 hypothetical protein CU669_04115 [Paramagnetospirillum kuznetsovii]
MGLFRFCRHALRSFVILMEQFPAFMRLAWVCVGVSIVSTAVGERYPLLAGVTDLLARGVFAVAWLRLVARGEMPTRMAYFRLGRREVFTAFGWMLAETFVTFPAQVIGASLAMATGIPLADAAMPLLGFTHLLIGAVYLLPAEAALEQESGADGWRLPDVIMKGGVAVSIAVALAWLPANLLMEAARMLPDMEILEGLTLVQTVAIALRYLAMAITAGTVALIWNELTAKPAP